MSSSFWCVRERGWLGEAPAAAPDVPCKHPQVSVILDGQLAGHVDQVNGILELSGASSGGERRKYESLRKWADQLKSLQEGLCAKLS